MKLDTKKIREKLSKIKSKSTTYSSEAYYHYFDSALKGIASPEIHVVPSEPGSGKSLGIQKYLRAYRDGGFLPEGSSIAVFLSRRDEIKSYIRGVGLVGDEYAVLDSQPPLTRIAEYGGVIDPTKAPILFVTSQLLMSRCGPSFLACEDLFYRGQARPLRIWDEEFRIAKAVSVSADNLAGIRIALRSTFSGFAAQIDNLENELKAAKEGVSVSIPASFDLAASKALAIGGAALGKRDREALKGLAALAGKVACRSQIMRGVPCLVAEEKRLPADIAPLFVFDASARVDEAYETMKKAGLPIVVHASRPLSYLPARFHHMKLSASRSGLRGAAARTGVVLEAARVINDNAEEPWIVIYNDLKVVDITAELKAACVKPSNLHFVKWGDHRAKNGMRHISRVMCIGLLRYPASGYDEAHISAGGNPADLVNGRPSRRNAELKSTMLQGFARSNMRNHALGQCGACEIYIIDAEKFLPDRLGETFPGCRVESWKPSVPKLSRQQRDIFEFIRALSTADLEKGVKKADVYRGLSIDKSNFRKQLTTELRSSLADIGVVVDRYRFYTEP